MESSHTKTIILSVVGIAVLIGVLVFAKASDSKPGQLDSFATCLGDKGAKFFGAFWCPHCQAQKALFGKSAKLLPYTECSTADGKGMLPICIENKIEGFPTWEFADASRLTGEVPLATLSEKTSCPLPN
jgi:hypothetical protein